MKHFLATITLLGMLVVPHFVEAKTTSVKGYLKPSSGKYVAPSYRSAPNKVKFDNFSSKGNYNPFTGKKGYVDPYKIKFK